VRFLALEDTPIAQQFRLMHQNQNAPLIKKMGDAVERRIKAQRR
jgi:hypothetical protein